MAEHPCFDEQLIYREGVAAERSRILALLREPSEEFLYALERAFLRRYALRMKVKELLQQCIDAIEADDAR